MLIGYARVSTADQRLDLQNDALTQDGCERIFTDTASAANAARTGLEQALAFARQGDTLVVWKLDRLGRSLRHLVETLADLRDRGIGFRSLQESIDTTTSGGKLVFHVFAALAEFERDLIRERTRAGLGSTPPGPAARGADGGGSSTRRSGPRPSPCTRTSRTPSRTSAGRSGSVGARSIATSPKSSGGNRTGEREGPRGPGRMPGSFLTETERKRLKRFPEEVPAEDFRTVTCPLDRGPRRTG